MTTTPATTPTGDRIAEAAAAPTPRDAVAALYPGWGLVADGCPNIHCFILHRDDQWIAGTFLTKSQADVYWPDMDVALREAYLHDALTKNVTVSGAAEDLLNAVTAAATATDDSAPGPAQIAATLLDLLDDATRASHLTLLALSPTGNTSLPAELLRAYNDTNRGTFGMYFHYAPGADTPVTTETAANTPTATVHTKLNRANNGRDEWSLGNPVRVAAARPFFDRHRNSPHYNEIRANLRFQLRDPDGNVIDEA